MNSKKWLIGFLLLWIFQGASACSGSSKAVTRLQGLEGRIEIQVPHPWKVSPNLHPSADIQAEDPEHNQYLLVISEEREKTKFANKEEYSQFTREPLAKRLTEAFLIGPKRQNINGLPGITYEIRGRSPYKNSVVYLHTVLESPRYFHQIVLWTHEKTWEQNRAGMNQITETFQEN